MTTIHLDLPDPIVNFIHSLSKREDAFAREAIEKKVIREKQKNLDLLLIEGYQATIQEDIALAKVRSYWLLMLVCAPVRALFNASLALAEILTLVSVWLLATSLALSGSL